MIVTATTRIRDRHSGRDVGETETRKRVLFYESRMNETTRKPAQKGMVAQALAFAWDFGVIVAAPLVALALLGTWLDRRYGTEPWMFLGGVVVSIVITSVLVVMKLTKIIKDISPKDTNKQ